MLAAIRTELLAHAINQSQQIPISTLLKIEKLSLRLEANGATNQKHLWSKQLWCMAPPHK